LIAEQFGLPPERVHILQGDTDKIATGLGTGGSASIPTGGVSVQRAAHDLGGKLKEIAAEALETSAGDLEISDGRIRIAGTDRSISFADLAKRPNVDPSKLNSSGPLPRPTALIRTARIWPKSRSTRHRHHQDRQLRHRRRFRGDAHPLLLAGQVHGGAMQGIGQALMEQAVFSSDGQLVTGTFMDTRCRAQPTARRSISRPITCLVRPSVGREGCGRGRRDRFLSGGGQCDRRGLWREYKIDHIDMPATAERWIAIREAQRRHNL